MFCKIKVNWSHIRNVSVRGCLKEEMRVMPAWFSQDVYFSAWGCRDSERCACCELIGFGSKWQNGYAWFFNYYQANY